jgi:hypothetical protein
MLIRPALSFHIAHSSKNMSIRAERAADKMRLTGQFAAPNWGPDSNQTYLTFATGFGGGKGLTANFLNSLGLPIAEITEEHNVATGRNDLTGVYTHPSNEYWFKSLSLYHGINGTSIIVPFWGLNDVFLLHFVILYALSIVVRYLPSLWYEIDHGSLDHIKALLEEYIVITDRVLPRLAIERIAGINLRVLPPDSLMGPT